ncbi:hypothetical protein G7Y79_00033g068520 [Physcia stellaris]|nr:hypothetical protein G7Y79_00033g068520 [Physcia stellaris]
MDTLDAEESITSTLLETWISGDDDNPGLDPSTQYAPPALEEDDDSVLEEDNDATPLDLSAPRPRLDNIHIPLEIRQLNGLTLSDRRSTIHQTYSDLLADLARATDTLEESKITLERLPVAIRNGKGVPLDQHHPTEMHFWACGMIVHVWQSICLKSQSGMIYNNDHSLSSQCATHYLAAWVVVSQKFGRVPHNNARPRSSSFDDFKAIVEWWEDHLFRSGGLKLYKMIAAGIPDPDSSIPDQRNALSEKYLQVLNQRRVRGLAEYMLREEMDRKPCDGPSSRLRSVDSTSYEYNAIIEDAISILISMDSAIMTALIDGRLSRKAEVPCHVVANALRKIQTQQPQPSIYQNNLCDYQGVSPTPRQWHTVCDIMLEYFSNNHLATIVDQKIHPNKHWGPRLAARGLRRYTEERTWLENEDDGPCAIRRGQVRFFIAEMQQRIGREESLGRYDVPLDASVVEIGFSNNPPKRLWDHSHHRSSNYIMNLSEAVFEYLYPGMFRIQQLVVFACFASEHCWLGEILITNLSQGYTHHAGGFSHHPAGNSNGSSYRKVSARHWDMYFLRVIKAGYEEALAAEAKEVTERFEIEQVEQEKDKEAIQAEDRMFDVLDDCFSALRECGNPSS